MSSSKFLYLLVFVISRVAFVSRKKTLFYQGRVINLQPLVQAREVQYHFYLGMDYTEAPSEIHGAIELGGEEDGR